MVKCICALCVCVVLVFSSVTTELLVAGQQRVVARQDRGDVCCRIVAKACGPSVTSLVVKDGRRMTSGKMVTGSLAVDCAGPVDFEFASPVDCDSGKLIHDCGGRKTYEFKNGDHVHLKAVKNKKTGEVEVRADHDD